MYQKGDEAPRLQYLPELHHAHSFVPIFVLDFYLLPRHIRYLYILGVIYMCMYSQYISVKIFDIPTCQVATGMGILSLLYMRLFLPDSIRDNSLGAPIVISETLSSSLLEDCPGHRNRIFRAIHSVREMTSLLRSRCVFFFLTFSFLTYNL